MKKLSFWSKQNPIPARLLIALCHLALISLGIISGIATYLEDFAIPSRVLYILFIVFAIAFIFYPLRGKTEGLLKYSWKRRVKHDIILVLSYACILTCGVNQFAFQPISSQESALEVRLMIFKPGGETQTLTKKESRNMFAQTVKGYRAEIKTQLKLLKAEWKESKGKKDNLVPVKILLVLLVLGVALAAAAGIGSLACELSCSGQEGLAVIVAIVGSIAIILLSILAIRAIVKMGKKHVIPPDTSEKVIVRESS